MNLLFSGGHNVLWGVSENPSVLLFLPGPAGEIIALDVFLSLQRSLGDPANESFLPYVLQGIQFLIENDLLQSSPEDVAQFLYKGEGLNKTVIGDYLGER